MLQAGDEITGTGEVETAMRSHSQRALGSAGWTAQEGRGRGSIPAYERDLSSQKRLKVLYRTLNKTFQNFSNFQCGQLTVCVPVQRFLPRKQNFVPSAYPDFNKADYIAP